MQEKKVSVLHLKEGMYVSNLDRPWTSTPFLFQGFLIRGPEEIEELKKHCKFVYIDVERGSEADHYLEDTPQVSASREDPKTIKVEEILPRAKAMHQEVVNEVRSLMNNALSGKPVDIEALSQHVSGMVENTLQNTDAFLLLTRLKDKDNYSYTHSINCSIYAILLGKSLNLKTDELNELALGAMLFDVGKVKFPAEFHTKPGPLSPAEVKVVRKHVFHSLELLSQSRGVKKSTLDVALNHHERFDGTGYPNQKKESMIPLFARIAGIVDTYDAMTSHRAYSKEVSHEVTIKELYSRRNIEFQSDLLEQFIQCLGIYPTGSLVELSTGEVGVVVQQNSLRRLRPRVMLLLDRNKEFNNYFPIINLMTEMQDNKGNPLEIIKTLPPGAFGINPADYYL